MRRLLLVLAVLLFIALPLAAKEMTILVQPFENTGDAAYGWISAGMTASVISDLGRIRDVTVISDAERRKAAEEISLGQSGLVDEQKAVKVGNLLGANLIFSGSYQVAGMAVRVNATLTDVAKGSVEKSVKVDGTLGGIFELQDRIVFALMEETQKIAIADVKPVRFTAEEKKQIEAAPRPSLSAYELYAKGLQARKSNPRQALDLFAQALKIQPDYLSALVEAGYTAGETLNLFAEGLGYLERAEALYLNRAETGTKEYAGLLTKKGQVFKSMGKPAQALELYARAREIREALGMQKTQAYAGLIASIGGIYSDLNQFDKALESYAKARELYEALGKQKSNSYSIVIMNTGVVYAKMKKDDDALAYYTKSREIEEDLHLENTRGYAILIMDIGNIYLKRNDLDRAAECYARSRAIRDALGLHETVGYASLLINIAMVQEKKGNGDLAGKTYREAYTIFDKTGYTGDLKERALKNAQRLRH